MAGITLTQAESRLNLYLAAEEKVLLGQSYKIGERELRRADLSEIRKAIEYWDQKVKEMANSASGRGRAVNLSARW